jgi:hypothetical protein
MAEKMAALWVALKAGRWVVGKAVGTAVMMVDETAVLRVD